MYPRIAFQEIVRSHCNSVDVTLNGEPRKYLYYVIACCLLSFLFTSHVVCFYFFSLLMGSEKLEKNVLRLNESITKLIDASMFCFSRNTEISLQFGEGAKI